LTPVVHEDQGRKTLATVWEDLLKNIRREKVDAERWKKCILFIAIFGLVLMLVVGLPRFLARNDPTFRIIRS
jgi:hypothetical protein